MPAQPLARLRALCLALPEATEKEAWGHPTFRVKDKIFATYSDDTGRPSLWCKGSAGAQEVLVASDPARFYVPAYVGHRGWIGVWLQAPIDWNQLADLIEESYRLTAPKRLAARLDD
jgi:predicted DNA-binding protein (MmcQ/YjbR family)